MFRGFDTYAYPGDQVMAELKPLFDFVGFYIRAPSHPDASFKGKREHLVAAGWGLIPIFVGQQAQGPGGHVLTAPQGKLDGLACVAQLTAEKFPKGSTVFVDLENGPPFGQVQQLYVAALIDRIEFGGYRAGVYCSHLIAGQVAELRPHAPIWAVKVPTTDPTDLAPPFGDPPDPAGSGWGQAVAWQHRQNCELTVGGVKLRIDLNSARTADPSAPPAASAEPPPIGAT